MPTAPLPAITRSGRDLPADYPRNLPATLFDIGSVGGVAVAGDDTQSVVLQLDAVQPADAGSLEDVRDSIAEQIAQGTRSDVVELLVADLRSNLGVEVDRASGARMYETPQCGRSRITTSSSSSTTPESPRWPGAPLSPTMKRRR